MNLSPNEVLLVALLALLLLGPKRLPIVMRRAGQMIGGMRRWSTEVRQEVEAVITPTETPTEPKEPVESESNPERESQE